MFPADLPVLIIYVKGGSRIETSVIKIFGIVSRDPFF